MTDGFPRKFGKYHLLAPLAQGGMGALYLAVTGDRGLEKLCVIKTVLPHLADAEYVARFRDEAKVVVKLSHGNLVPVFDAGQVGGEIFLAMDFVEGKDLRAVWNRCAKKGVAFPIDVAVYIAKELCRGLAYAHAFGDLRLVHRDVSPPNVLVSFSGEVKLTDFGLASSTLKLEKTAPGVIYGKVSYMSPEQARGEPLDGRTDLYAAAIILWELLTGRQLFPPGEAQPQDLIARAKDPRPDPPSKRAPRVPPALDEIVLTALHPDRLKRYQAGEEFRAALAGWLAKEAPATDSARLEKFVTGLFAEDVTRERAEREALVAKTRNRMASVPGEDVRVGVQGDDEGPTTRDGFANRHSTRKGIVVPVPQAGPGGSTIVQTGQQQSGGTALAVDVDVDESDGEDVIGQVIDGRYAVRALIGEGGMGRVYEAEHVEIGKRVALKILHPVYSRTPEVVARFRREARAASKIGHPNIVDVTDSGTTADGSVYFVMEFLEGVELAAVIDREGAIDIHRALNIGSQICRALAAAHNVGIIHRDLKPENVFLIVREGTTDFVKVLDFGIAKSTEFEEQRKERLTHPGMAMGTPEYMAPEQAAGKPADARSDVYAVGAILYEMLTGAPPYDGENFMEILTRKATQEPMSPRELRPELPEVVEKLVLKALARDPQTRPPSMEAFEYELTKCLAGRGVAVAKMLGMTLDAAVGMGDAMGGGVVPVPPSPSQGMMAAHLANEFRSSPPSYGSGLRTLPPAGPPVAASSLPAGASSPAKPASNPPAVDSSPVAAPVGSLSSEPMPVRSAPYVETSGTTVVQLNRRSVGGIYLFLLFIVGAAGGIYWYVTWRQDHEGKGPLTAVPSAVPADSAKPLTPDAQEPVKTDDKGDKTKPGPTATATADKGDKPKPGATNTPGDKGDKVDKPIPPIVELHDKPPPDKDAAPKDDKEAAALLTEAKGFEAQMQWQKARALYDRVAKGKFRRAEGLLGLANVAFQTKETDLAIDYAKAASDAGGGIAARMLLGHAYFKKGRWDEAIAEYKAVLKKSPNNREAQKALREAEKQRKRNK